MSRNEDDDAPLSHKTLWAMRVPRERYQFLRDMFILILMLFCMALGFALFFGMQWANCRLNDEEITLSQCFRPLNNLPRHHR